MMTLFTTIRRPSNRPATVVENRRFSLVRTFVETGDERCPIAGIWSRIEMDATPDEAELPRPVMRRLLPWQAFLPRIRRTALPAAI